MDHDSVVGGISLGVLALVLGVWAFFDVQAERVRGKGVAIGGIALGTLATLAMIGSLSDPGQVPVAEVPPPAAHTLMADSTDIDVNALPPPAAIPSRPAPIDVSGVWISTDGLRYRVRQDGRSISFDEYDDSGKLIGNGTGVIRGNRVDSEFQSSVEGPGRSQLVISENGQRMSGSYLLLSSGESGQTMLFRQ